MNALSLMCSTVGAAALAAVGAFVAPPADDAAGGRATTATATTGAATFFIAQDLRTVDPPRGRWEATLQPVGSLNIVVDDNGLRVQLNGKPVPPDRVAWQADNFLMVFDESRQRQFQVKLGEGSKIEAVRPGTWLEYVGSSAPRVAIGVYTSPLSPPLAAQLDLDPDGALLITSVVEDMPAFRSGVQQFDVITAVDNVSPVTDVTLRRIVSAKQEGEPVQLRLIRRAQPLELSVTVEAVKPLDSAEVIRELFPDIPQSGDILGGMNRTLTVSERTFEQGDFIFGLPTDERPVIRFDKGMDRGVLLPRQVLRNYVAPGEQFHQLFQFTAPGEGKIEVSVIELRLEALDARLANLEAMLARLVSDKQPVDDVTPAAGDRP